MINIEQDFQTLTAHLPRKFQTETISALLASAKAEKYEGIILRAPTGSGKTETAIAPFLIAQKEKIKFPHKLIYIVPLRTLANSLKKRTEELIERWDNQENTHSERKLLVTLQTGEYPEDPRFEGDIIFCTIDQLLSSFLNIPYSVGRGSANVNAGTIFASYLVFDELHLLDPDRSFTTLLKLLKLIQKISPFLLMTATLTDELIQEIEKEIE